MSKLIKNIPIIIPAYEPDDRMIVLLKEFEKADLGQVILVNDGSGKDYDKLFEDALNIIKPIGGVLLRHEQNCGKGKALKTAFEYVLNNCKDAIGVVTADSDGQHSIECIRSVANALIDNQQSLILGVRDFDSEGIPWKSQFGNKLTMKVLKYVSGLSVSDTQTGLRGIPRDFMAELINVKGDRFEFETQMLLETTEKYPIYEVKIKTIYDSEENHQTHFNPIVDSIKIYKVLGKRFLLYIFSALSSSVIDLALFTLFCHIFKDGMETTYIFTSTVLARMISATYNYTINYKKVFMSNESVIKSVSKYAALAVIQMICSAGFVWTLVNLFRIIPEVIIKIVVDTLLFFVSYKIQQKYVFKK